MPDEPITLVINEIVTPALAVAINEPTPEPITVEVQEAPSAYRVAVANGFVGTEPQWLESLEGTPGQDGSDATVDAANVGAVLNAATAKTTLVNADTLPLSDSAASGILKKITWANIKTALSSVFAALSHTHVSANIADASFGGNDAADAEKLVKFGAFGEIVASAFLRVDRPGTANSGNIHADNVTAKRTVQVPDASGIMALKSDINAFAVGLGSVEDTALSTWGGSSNITTIGTISSGSIPVSLITGLGSAATEDATDQATPDTVAIRDGSGGIKFNIIEASQFVGTNGNASFNSYGMTVGNSGGSAASPFISFIHNTDTAKLIAPADLSPSQEWNLPVTSGTLALTSDIPGLTSGLAWVTLSDDDFDEITTPDPDTIYDVLLPGESP
jgi:hypothetical protein